MRVLITGAGGQVGHELLRQTPAGIEAIGLTSAELDISNGAQVAETVARLQPALIINAAAYTAVDKAESEPERAHAVNAAGVGHLAQAAAAAGIALLHISTDYVFPGDAEVPYREEDASGPIGVYGASKLAGEQAAALCPRHIVLRTSWVFASHGNNFVKTMLRVGAQREVLGVVADQLGGPTAAASIAGALWQIAGKWQREGELPWGIYHYSGAPACSWHAFAEEIFRQAVEMGLLSRAPQVNAITTADYPTPARRPAWSVLDCTKIQRELGISQPDWKQDLRQALCEIVHTSAKPPA